MWPRNDTLNAYASIIATCMSLAFLANIVAVMNCMYRNMHAGLHFLNIALFIREQTWVLLSSSKINLHCKVPCYNIIVNVSYTNHY